MHIDDYEVALRINEVLGGMFGHILKYKTLGVGRSQDVLLPSERAFLARSLNRLSDSVVEGPWQKALHDTASAVQSNNRGAISPFQNRWRMIGQQIGLSKILAVKADGEAARYFLAQMLFLEALHWRNPLDCLFFAACQNAVHKALRSEFGGTETQYTQAFLSVLPQIVRDNIVKPFNELTSGLPRRCHLQFATASMQGPGNKDLQGADLAIVVGTLLCRKPVWRVVLLQAKVETSRGKSNVGYKRGAQLAEILSSGTGAYLFYPKPEAKKIFIPTVRLAEEVFADVYDKPGKPKFGNIDTCGADGSAWDFAAFIALRMRRPTASDPGRVFRSTEAVASALSIGRELPLDGKQDRPKGLLIASALPQLDVLEFLPLLEANYPTSDFAGLPGISDPIPKPKGSRSRYGR